MAQAMLSQFSLSQATNPELPDSTTTLADDVQPTRGRKKVTATKRKASAIRAPMEQDESLSDLLNAALNEAGVPGSVGPGPGAQVSNHQPPPSSQHMDFTVEQQQQQQQQTFYTAPAPPQQSYDSGQMHGKIRLLKSDMERMKNQLTANIEMFRQRKYFGTDNVVNPGPARSQEYLMFRKTLPTGKQFTFEIPMGCIGNLVEWLNYYQATN